MDITAVSGITLIVDDDEVFAAELSSYLVAHGFAVDHVTTLDAAMARIAINPPKVLVLDQFLGSEDSLSELASIRQKFFGGLMMLTGNNDQTDRIVGLELGADDFVSKTVRPREILARLRALHRSHAAIEPKHSVPGRWRLDLTRRELFGPSGQIVPLTSAEFALLRQLAANTGKPVSRNALSLEVLHRRYDPMDRSIDNLVSRLRRKLEEIDPACRAVKSARGEGYIFVGFEPSDGSAFEQTQAAALAEV